MTGPDGTVNVEGLAGTLTVLANPTRLLLLDRLGQPRFASDLENELGLTRQALKKHLDQLVGAGLVDVRPSRRGVFPAAEYAASARGLFAFKEDVLALALPPGASPGSLPTRPAQALAGPLGARGPGLLVVHGHRRGEWLPLAGRSEFALGRDEKNDIALPWDPFASGKHALLRAGPGWSLTDLHASNRTYVNFEPLAPGESRTLLAGDVIGLGRTLLVLRP